MRTVNTAEPVNSRYGTKQERLMNTSVTKLTTCRGAFAIATLFVTSAVATTTAVAATPSEDAISVHVRYDDLNLATDAGTKALYRRIVNAAHQVCPFSDSRELDQRVASERCQSLAVEKAVSDVHSTQLAAIHAARVSRG